MIYLVEKQEGTNSSLSRLIRQRVRDDSISNFPVTRRAQLPVLFLVTSERFHHLLVRSSQLSLSWAVTLPWLEGMVGRKLGQTRTLESSWQSQHAATERHP